MPKSWGRKRAAVKFPFIFNKNIHLHPFLEKKVGEMGHAIGDEMTNQFLSHSAHLIMSYAWAHRVVAAGCELDDDMWTLN